MFRRRQKWKKRSTWNSVTLEVKKITVDNRRVNFKLTTKLVENSMEVEFRKRFHIFCNIVFLSTFTFNSPKLKNETSIRKISFFVQVSSAYYLRLNILFVLIFSRQNCLFGRSDQSLRVLLVIKKKVGFLEEKTRRSVNPVCPQVCLVQL